MSLRHQVAWYMGITNPNGWPYLFFSGFGGILRDLIPWGLLALVWRKVTPTVVHHHHHHYHQGEQ